MAEWVFLCMVAAVRCVLYDSLPSLICDEHQKMAWLNSDSHSFRYHRYPSRVHFSLFQTDPMQKYQKSQKQYIC